MTIGEKILSLRKARGWSQEELAEQIGVTRQAVSRWESGAAKPDTDKVISICDLFGVSADYLIRDGHSGGTGVQSEEKTFILWDAIRSMTLRQWFTLLAIAAGALILAVLKIESGRTHAAGDYVYCYVNLDDYLDSNDLYWLWFTGLGLLGAGVLRIYIRLQRKWWSDLATFFNWNG